MWGSKEPSLTSIKMHNPNMGGENWTKGSF